MAEEELEKLRIDKKSVIARHGHRGWLLPVLLVVLVVLVMAGLLFWLSRRAVEVEMVTVAHVYPSQSFTLLNASGYVVAQRKASLAAKTTGRLEWLGVEEGSRVKRGQVLARLESRDLAESRGQAAANLESARSNLEHAHAELADATLAYGRMKELVSQGVVSRSEFDAAEARYKRASAAVASARWVVKGAQSALKAADVALDYMLIRTPFDAVVLTKNADVGDIVTPLGAAANAKASVVTVADLASLQVEADVSEANLAKVRVRQPCDIKLDALPDSRFRGEVYAIVPTADRSKASVMVKIRFIDKDPHILPEMSAKVAFLERSATADERIPKTALPTGAVVVRNGSKTVFVVRDERVAATVVTTGRRLGDMVEIVDGVKHGEKVVLKPSEKLASGDRVRVTDRK